MKKTILITTICFVCAVLIFNSCKKNTTANKTTAACNFTDTSFYVHSNNCYFFLPNIFSPNNDGINDVYVPLQSGVTNYSMLIKDGTDTLFWTTNINTGWDGTSNSVLMPPDDYHAVISANICGTIINWDGCFYLGAYNTSNCIPKPTNTTQLVFSDMVDPVTASPVYPSSDSLCP